MELDQTRAAAASFFSNTNKTVGDEPLIVDLFVSSPIPQGKHWIIETCSFVGQLQTRAPAAAGNGPVSGIFLCPPNTPIETLAQAQAPPTGPWNINARGISLPLADPYIDAAVLAGGGPAFAVQMATRVGYKFTIPAAGWFLRAIIVANAGTATPGPGVGSFGFLSCLALQEDNAC